MSLATSKSKPSSRHWNATLGTANALPAISAALTAAYATISKGSKKLAWIFQTLPREAAVRLDELVFNGDVTFLDAVARVEHFLIAKAMLDNAYNVSAAAHSLSLNRTTLSMMLKAKFLWHSDYVERPRKGFFCCSKCRGFSQYRVCQSCPKFDDALNLRPLMRGPESR